MYVVCMSIVCVCVCVFVCDSCTKTGDEITISAWHIIHTYHSLGKLVKILYINLFDHFRVDSDKDGCPSHEDTAKKHSRREYWQTTEMNGKLHQCNH